MGLEAKGDVGGGKGGDVGIAGMTLLMQDKPTLAAALPWGVRRVYQAGRAGLDWTPVLKEFLPSGSTAKPHDWRTPPRPSALAFNAYFISGEMLLGELTKYHVGAESQMVIRKAAAFHSPSPFNLRKT